MKSAFALGITGFSLIAITYGMARFAWGIMLPAIGQDIPLTPRLAGLIAACSYLAYCLSVPTSSLLAECYGSRLPAILAALCASLGLLLLAVSFSAVMLAAGIFIAGLSAGLASPTLAAAVSQTVAGERQVKLNTAINAGTGAGIIFSVLILFFASDAWRIACVVFAFLALTSVVPVRRYVPSAGQRTLMKTGNWREMAHRKGVVRLMMIAFISGMASAAWWSFGPELLQHDIGVENRMTSLLWLISGGAGIVAVFTGSVARYTGMMTIYCGSQLFMALPLLLLAFSQGFSWWLIPAVAMCGAGYVILTGVLLVYGSAMTPESPSVGVGIAFLMLAGGQIAGSVIFGQLYALVGADTALITFSLLSFLMLMVLPGGKMHSSPVTVELREP